MVSIKTITRGPFFVLGSGPVREAVRDSVKELLEEGEKAVTVQLYPGHGLDTGHYRRSINGRMLGSLHGEIHDSMVVYGPWLEGVSSRNESTRFKGYAMFRRAKDKLERMKTGILEKHVRRALGRLN